MNLANMCIIQKKIASYRFWWVCSLIPHWDVHNSKENSKIFSQPYSHLDCHYLVHNSKENSKSLKPLSGHMLAQILVGIIQKKIAR